MNLGLIGDENIHLTANMEWVNSKFLEILERAKPDWLVTYDLPGTAQLRKLVPYLPCSRPDDFDAFIDRPQIAVRRLVLIDRYYVPSYCEIALLDPQILAYTDYVVIFTNGQNHTFLDEHRQGRILEVNYLTRTEKWLKYA